MRILVTGGAGFIGTNFVHQAIDNPNVDYIVVLDSLTYAGQGNNLRSLQGNPKFKFIPGSICDSGLLFQIIAGDKIDTIVNFAAESHVDRSILDSSPFLNTNVKGTLALIEAAIHSSIKRFVHVSTDEVYGSLSEPEYANESYPLKPGNPYAASKASSDCFALAYANTYKFPIAITRCCNNYGGYQFPEKLIPLFVTNALQGQALPLYGTGTNIREWIHVSDHCQAIFHVLDLFPDAQGEIFNIGSGFQLSNIEMAEIICEELHISKSMIVPVHDRKGHDFRYALDSRKLRNTGWSPMIDGIDGLKETIEWYRKNTLWWKPLKDGKR